MEGFHKERRKYISVTEFNRVLGITKRTCNVFLHAYTRGIDSLLGNAFIDLSTVYIRLTCLALEDGKPVTYITRMDGGKVIQETSGMQAYSIMQRYHRVADLTENAEICRLLAYDEDFGKFGYGSSPILYSNRRFIGRRVEAWDYDINSSYPYALLQKLPDCKSHPRMYSKVGIDEIGFTREDMVLRVVENVGDTAEFIYPLIESPYRRFVEKYYNRKLSARKAHDIRSAEKAKQTMNYAVGYLQRKNPFMRAAIIHRANKVIRDLIDDDTIYCSTDSIVSARKRNDIPLGDEIGRFKIERHGLFAYVGFDYQWDDEVPHMRGIPTSWIKEYISRYGRYDILDKKPIPESNIYVFDAKDIRLVRRKDSEFRDMVLSDQETKEKQHEDIQGKTQSELL